MDRLFLRIYFALATVLAAAVIVVAVLRPEPRATTIEHQIGRMIQADPESVTKRFDGVGPEGFDTTARALGEELGHPVSVLPEEAVVGSVGGFARRNLGEGKPVVQLHDAGPAIYLPLESGPFVAVLRPGVRPPPPWRGPRGLVLGGLFLLAVAVVVYLSLRPLERQLASLTQAAIRVGGGDLDARATILRADAGGRLATRFNAMAERIQTMMEGRRTLLHGVSHELRTPLARLKFAIELLETSEGEDRTKRIGHILRDIEELETLVSELLRYAELEGDASVELQPLELRDVLGDLAEGADRVREGVDVRAEVPRGLPRLPLDQRLLDRAVGNLVNNAVRYARSTVVVSAGVEAGELLVHVDDDGPGVPPSDRARIFEPFTRLDAARSRDTGGIGLGLALAMRSAEAVGATLRVGEADLGGARFTWALPLPE